MTEKQALDYTRILYCNSSGNYYSWRNKNKPSDNTTILKHSYNSIGFTKEQLDKIINVANGHSILFVMNDNSHYYDSKTKFDEDLIFFYNKGYKSTYIYPLESIRYIQIYD